jgi:indole-3-glycerol phosphate synthase
MSDILTEIYAAKAARFRREEAEEPYAVVVQRALARVTERRPFAAALTAATGGAIVGEIKRASPSAGLIARNFDPAAIARVYDAAGVDAVSVLTEADHFLGDLAYLDIVRASASRPILRKDFLNTRYGIAQSAAHGADAILLIVAGCDDNVLRTCMDEAARYALDVLFEVHDAAELDRAGGLGATLVGINNRNLRTFETDLAVSERLFPLLPAGVFGISESGMRNAGDLDRLRVAGARGFLIGESLMRADDPAALIATLKCARA